MSFYDTFKDLLVSGRPVRDATGRRGGGAGGTIDGETAARFAAEFGGYLQPGTGLVDAGGYYPALTDPNRAYYPSLPENVRQGNYGAALGQALGLAGDALYTGGGLLAASGIGAPAGGLLLGMGAIAKSPKALSRALDAVRAADAVGDATDVVKGASRTGRLARASKAAARNMKKGATATVFDNVTDYDQALAMARRGEHLKQSASGQYIGAPRSDGPIGLTVDSPQALSAMRRQADAKVHDGMFNATWYDRARRIANAISGNNTHTRPGDPAARMASMFARGGAAYSPQAMPPVEVNAFLRQHNAKVIGNQDIVPRTGSQARNVAKAYRPDPATGGFELRPEVIRLGKKTGPYGDAKDPTVPPEALFKTASDIWHGRVMGYSNPGGRTFSRGFTPQEHGFLTGENLLLADRANLAGASPPDASPGFRMDPRAAQAATWGAEREAAALAKRTKKLAKYEKELGTWQRKVAAWEKKGKPGKKPPKPPKPAVQSDAARKAPKSALDAVGLDTVDVGDAIHVGRYNSTGADGEEIQKLIDQALSGVDGAKLTRGRWETGIEMPPWSRTEGTGDVTRYLEGQLTRPDIYNAPQRLDAAGLPSIIANQDDVLRRTAQRTGMPLRQDLMKLREIVGQSGFTGLLDYVKKYGYAGLPAVGGGAILLPGLLEEQQERERQQAGLLY